MANDKTKVRTIIDTAKAAGRTSLTAPEGKRVCDAYGIATPKEALATSAAQAAKAASDMGFPVVMKIVSPDILHKTEAGGVLLDVRRPWSRPSAATPRSSPTPRSTRPTPTSSASRCSRC